MKTHRHRLILFIAALILGVAAPAARAGHKDFGARCAILLIHHRACGVSQGGTAASTPSVTIVEPSRFDWGDAGVGAAGTFGLMLLAGGVVIASRHGHRVRRKADIEAPTGI